jgi:hypothetical protein
MTIPVKDFIIQRLLEFDSTFDTGAGVPTTGLLIEPLSVILQPVVDELSLIQQSSSILTILESSDPDSFPEDIVDGLASNAFVERNPGNIGSDVMRIRFFEPQDFESQQGVLIFRGSGGQRFTNSEAFFVSSAEMSLNREGTLYYADIPIVSLEEGEEFNVSAGDITSMEAEPQGVANLANRFGISDGRDRETNTELIDRIKVAVTVRALVTGRGIIVSLTENFTTIEEVTPIGFGDAEMMRDIVYNVHIGGNVDVYVKTPNFNTGSIDVFGIEVDTSRQRETFVTVVLIEDSIGYFLGRANVDSTNFAPVVKSIDGLVLYEEGDDYTISEPGGTIFRNPTGAIVALEEFAGVVTDTKTMTQVGEFATAKKGMILTIDTPASVSGQYTIKEVPDADTVVIYGDFAIGAETGVNWKVSDNLSVQYEYNPITVDVIEVARATNREPFTITDVPMMYIESVEVLDPISGEPTGEALEASGGFGTGGFGAGGFGVGGGSNFNLIVTESTLRHSSREDNFIEFNAAYLGYALRINYLYADAVPPIQAYMDDRNNQSMTASLLARHYIPVYVDALTPIIYDVNAADEATSLSEDEMTELVKDLIDDIDEAGDLELSDVIDVMYDNGAVRVDLGTLQDLRGAIHNHDGSITFTLPDDAGSMVIPDDEIADPTDRPLSPRIARFLSRDVTVARNAV